MFKIRTVKTSSGSTAVQVVEYHFGSRKIINHIGSAKNDQELLLLKQRANDWIILNDKQPSLFNELPLIVKNDEDKNEVFRKIINWNNYRSFGAKYKLLYQAFSDVINLFEFNKIGNQIDDQVNSDQINLLSDLVILDFLYLINYLPGINLKVTL